MDKETKENYVEFERDLRENKTDGTIVQSVYKINDMVLVCAHFISDVQ